MIHITGLVSGHYECRSLAETIPVLTNLLGLEVVAEGDRLASVKHPNTDWLLLVHEDGTSAPDKPRMNHYGVRVATDREIENAHEYLQQMKKDFRLKVDKIRDNHHAHSVHFLEPGGNWWEIESYEKAVNDGMALTTAPHWKKALSEPDFPGRGYIPQALTHGTLQCDDLKQTRRFYEEALGLEVVQLWPTSIYVKHRSSPWYIVNLESKPESRKYLSPAQRFTLNVESPLAVIQAYEWLKEHKDEYGLAEVAAVQEHAGVTSFLLADLNRNWWEIASPRQGLSDSEGGTE